MRLNGIELESLDEGIKLLDITESSPQLTTQTADNAKYDGLRLIESKKTQRTIKVDFTIRHRNKARRREALDEVLAWLGSGGTLELDNRDGLQLEVAVTELPSLGSVRDYMRACSITFTAYDPYWVNAMYTKAALTLSAGTQGKATLSPYGSAEMTFLEFDIKNTSPGAYAMSTATVTVNGRSFAFSGLSLAAGKTLNVFYSAEGYLKMSIDGASIVSKRTAASADDLILYQRETNEIKVTTGTPSSVTLKCKGRWL